MTAHDSGVLLEAALDAVAAASTVCRFVQQRLDSLRALTKDDDSPVTIADFASQAIVAGIMAEVAGDLPLVAEESGAFLRAPEHAAHLSATIAALRDSGVWPDATEREVLKAIDRGSGECAAAGFLTLDPIDGTKGFVRNQQYAVCLAYIVNGRPVVGVLGCPNLEPLEGSDPDVVSPRGCTYFAMRGEGASVQFDTHAEAGVTVESNVERTDLEPDEPARLAESVEASHGHSTMARELMALASPAGVLEPMRVDSQCKYALVARADADAYIRLPSKKGYINKIWDHAPGTLIAQEAGCIVTDALGRELDFGQGTGLSANIGVIAAPPSLHARLIASAKKLGIA